VTGEDPLAPLIKVLKKVGTLKKADKKIKEDSKPVGIADKSGEFQKFIIALKVHTEMVTASAEDKPKTEGSKKASTSKQATEDEKEKGDSKQAGNADASGEFPTHITSLKVKEESTAGKKRKSRRSLDIGENSNKLLINKHILIRAVDTEPNPPAHRSLRNTPKQHEGSPSSLVVPLASIGSTPDPSPNDTPMEEWGTGVPSGAFFKSNPKSFIDKVKKGEDEDNDEDDEGEREDDKATEDDEA
jgi:hypothetical protein